MRDHWRDGARYEMLAAQILSRNGFDVYHMPGHWYDVADLVVGPGITIEVKGAIPRPISGNKWGYQFLMHKVGASAKITEDFVALLPLGPDDNSLFIIPRLACSHVNIIAITQVETWLYKGVWEPFLNAFQRLEQFGAARTDSGRDGKLTICHQSITVPDAKGNVQISFGL